MWAIIIFLLPDTVDRFPTVKDFVSYSRLVKGSVTSTGKVKGLTGGKMGNAYLRWTFGEQRGSPLVFRGAFAGGYGVCKMQAIRLGRLPRGGIDWQLWRGFPLIAMGQWPVEMNATETRPPEGVTQCPLGKGGYTRSKTKPVRAGM